MSDLAASESSHRDPLHPGAMQGSVEQSEPWISPQPPTSSMIADKYAKQLERFAMQGGPDLSDLRAVSSLSTYQVPSDLPQYSRYISVSRQPSNTVEIYSVGNGSSLMLDPHQTFRPQPTKENGESVGRRSGTVERRKAYNHSFEHHLRAYHIKFLQTIPPDLDPPLNGSDLKAVLSRGRSSTRYDFDKFDVEAEPNAFVLALMHPVLQGSNQALGKQTIFKNLKRLTNIKLIKAQPDWYDGCLLTELDRDIRDAPGRYIVPVANSEARCLPNFVFNATGSLAGRYGLLRRQSMYDGSLCARGIHQLRRYINPATALDGNAYTIAMSYDGEIDVLTAYVTRLFDWRADKGAYQTFELKSWSLGERKSFQTGIRAFRNRRDWAAEQRALLIVAANRKAVANRRRARRAAGG